MEYPEKHYYKLNRVLLLASGFWPYQNVWSARLIRGIITVIALSIAFAQLTSIFISDLTRDFVVFMIQLFVIVIGIIYHTYAHIGHLDKFKKLFKHMCQDWALQKTDNEIRIMHQYAETARSITSYFTLLTCGIQIMYFVGSGDYLCRKLKPVFDLILPMNKSHNQPRQSFDHDFLVDEEWRYFYVIRFYIFIAIITSSIVFLADSALFLALTQHACAMYKLLGHRAEHLFYIIERGAESDLHHETRIRCGKTAVFVQLHYNIVQFIDMIEACYTIPLLIDLAGCVLALSITLTQISSIIVSIEIAIRSLGLSCVTLCYLFIYNYMGQKITDMSLSIYTKLYDSAWYDAIISEQYSLLLIMKRCFHPFVLTGCKFYVMSLHNFGMVLRMAISYCMFFQRI